MVSSSFIQGAALLNLQAVSEAVLTAPTGMLLPWAWKAGDCIQEVARNQVPSDQFSKGVAALIQDANRSPTSTSKDARRKLFAGLTTLGDYRWSQAVLLGVIRGESWVQGIPLRPTVHEAAAQASQRVKLFSKSTVGLMREILRGKRKEVRVVPLRLDSAIQIGVAKKFLRQRRLYTDTDKLLKDFDEVISGLRARGARFYYFDLGAEPGNIGLWKKFLKNRQLASLDFADLQSIFNVCSHGWVSEELPSKIAHHPAGASLCRRALLHGYAFEEAIDFCLENSDPFQRAEEIENCMAAFQEGKRDCRKFSQLREVDKIALYALVVPFFGIGLRETPVPAYSEFLSYLEIYLSLSGGSAAQIFQPFSDFVRLSVSKWGPHNEECVYGLFLNMFQVLKKKRRFREPLERFHRALADRDHPLPYFAVRSVVQSVDQTEDILSKKIESLLIVLEANLKLSSTVEEEVYHYISWVQMPLEFIKHLRHYRENPFMDKSWAKMTKMEHLALFAVTADHFKIEEGLPYPTFDHFYPFVAMEWAQGTRSERKISLKEFAVSIGQIQKGLRPFAKLKNLFQHRLMQGWRENPEKLIRLRKGLLRSNKLLNRTFMRNRKGIGRADILEAALELFERGYAMDGELFQRYASAPDRLRRLEEVESRAQRLAHGETTGDLEDPFEVLAILRLLRDTEDPVLGAKSVTEILGRVKRVPLDPSVELAPVDFKATSQKFLINEKVDKNLIRELAAEITENLSLLDVVRKILAAPLELGLIPKGVLPAIREWLRVSSNAEISERALTLDEEGAAKLAVLILRTMSLQGVWNPKTVKMLLMAFTSEDALSEASIRRIQSFQMNLPAREIILILDEIKNFFETELPATVRRVRRAWIDESTNEKKDAIEKIFREENFTSKERKKLKKIFREIEQLDSAEESIVLLPSRDKVDALFGHVADNCLAKDPDYAFYGFTDSTFVPLRILINGEWKGTIMTFTRFIEGRKVLILSGIDSQVPFKPDQFLDRLEEKFAELAERGGYDLVLLTAGAGTVSSRRSFLQDEAWDRYKSYKKKFFVESKIPLVKRGPGEEPNERNFYGLHNEFLIVVDRR